jgi:hypothetical protein
MPIDHRQLRRWVSIVALAVLGVGGYYGYRLSLIGSAFHAKTLCSGVFVSGRAASAVEAVDVSDGVHPLLRLVRAEIDYPARTVRAGLFGLNQREAVYRDGLGCTLAIGVSADTLRAAPGDTPRAAHKDLLWPNGEAVNLGALPPTINADALRAAVDAAFDAPEPARSRRTRAVVIVHDGRIVAERYAPGFSADTALLGWSLTKTATNALVGILVREGRLTLDRQAPVAEWRGGGDARAAITVEQLLRMTSGLAFDENYDDPFSDVVTMLYGLHDMAAYAATRPLIAAPGSVWKYSTGTTNILARIVQQAAADSATAQRSFPRRALFDRLGMSSAVLELDAAGTFGGAMSMYASARDWARLGLLYLNDGTWNRERLLPSGWVQYSLQRATPEASAGFGAHLWNEVTHPYFNEDGPRPSLPPDAFHMAGHEGQLVSMVPSRKLVVVRLGLSRKPQRWDQEKFLDHVLRSVSSTP